MARANNNLLLAQTGFEWNLPISDLAERSGSWSRAPSAATTST